MTDAQIRTREAHAKAWEAHRIAPHGFRLTTERKLREATIEILKADTEALREMKQQRLEVAA